MLVQISYYITIFYPIAPALNYAADYRGPHYWPARVIPNFIYQYFVARIPFLIIEWYITASSIYASTFLGTMAVFHVKVLKFWTGIFWYV
jgi:hypothetical protein